MMKSKKSESEKRYYTMKDIPILQTIWKSDVCLAILVNVLFLISILLFCDIKYEVSDDFVMAAIMSGAYGDAPNPHMIFINILWGYLMLPFYYLFPNVSWYLIFQLGLILISLVLVSYMLLKKLNRPMAFLLIIILLTFFADDAYILVQFTKTAMLAVMGGGIVFAWSLFGERNWKLKILSAIICLAGTLIRFNIIYIAGGFLLLILIVEFGKLFWKERKNKGFQKKIARITIPGIMVIVFAFGLYSLDSYIYNQNEEYRYFKEYGKARGAIVDASDYGYEAYRDELEKIGVSENDYKLMRTWNFADNEVFTLEVMQKTAEIIADYKKNIEISKEMILENMQTRGITGYPVFLATAFLIVLICIFQRRYSFAGFCSAGLGFIYILYFFLRERVVYRMEYAVFVGIFLSVLYFWKENEGDYVENRRKCVILSLLCLAMQMILYLPDRSYQAVTSEERKSYIDDTFFESWNYDARKYRKNVNKGKPENGLIRELETHKENLYFLDFQTTMQTLHYEWNPFQALPTGYFDNALYFASVMTNFPEERVCMEEYGITQPLKELVYNNVYLIDTDTRTLDNKVKFIQEHYYPNAYAELYKKIDEYQIWKFHEE